MQLKDGREFGFAEIPGDDKPGAGRREIWFAEREDAIDVYDFEYQAGARDQRVFGGFVYKRADGRWIVRPTGVNAVRIASDAKWAASWFIAHASLKHATELRHER